MKKISFFILKLFAYIFVAVLCLLALLGFLLWNMDIATEHAHEKDTTLIQNLNIQIQDYEKLIAMFYEDQPISTIHPTHVYPLNAISAERHDEYKKLFTKLKLDAGIWHCHFGFGKQCIEFISTAQGMTSSGTSKGYMFKPENTTNYLYDNLDKRPDNLKKNEVALKKINDDWFLFYLWD